MSLFDQIIDWDKQTLLDINSYHLPWLDRFMWLLSDTTVWVPLLLVFLFILFKNKQSSALLVLFMFALLILFTDQISSSVIKPLVGRLRPTHDTEIGDWVNVVNNYHGGKYGFISSHAANVFAFAGFSLLLLQSGAYTISILLWASLVSFSRVYLGVHYPLDVLCGAAFGFISSYVMYMIYEKLSGNNMGFDKGHNMYSYRDLTRGEFKKNDIYLLIYSLLFVVVILIVASFKLSW